MTKAQEVETILNAHKPAIYMAEDCVSLFFKDGSRLILQKKEFVDISSQSEPSGQKGD